MQLYELLFIIIPSITDAETEKTIKELLDSLKKGAGELVVKEQKLLGRRKFTYPINHLTEGTYVLIDFEAETEHIQAINRAIELNDSVLRHMIVKKQIKSTEQIEKEEKLKIEMQQNRMKRRKRLRSKRNRKDQPTLVKGKLLLKKNWYKKQKNSRLKRVKKISLLKILMRSSMKF